MTETTWVDPWLRLREKTAIRNDVHEIADSYAKMGRLALLQYNRLKDRPKAAKATLEGLLSIIAFCTERANPLFEKLAALDAELCEETERLNHE